ncbi:MAG TPA: 3-phosphoserine/phosphohydroxythreonine transaminase [Thermoanaerobaculia bacterium]|nr:3-phosphoserine/phosphohydroxythreonine transaminase [Thermoanaerobaculia bacterium]
MREPVYNFGAGPAMLPEEVLAEAQRDLLDYRGSGMSVMELSHRSPTYEEIHLEAIARIRELLGAGEEFDVLLLQGGASLQFSMVPMNLLRRRASYVLTGAWSKKAAKEARRHGEVQVAASTEAEEFARIPAPEELFLDPESDYLHVTSNNTIFGTQWRAEPPTPDGVPLVADVSSDFLSRPLPLERYGLLYAGAQKNLGPAGLTVVVLRRELLSRCPETLPAMLSYRTHSAAGSLYNTPPCWAIYVSGLVCRWITELGGLEAMARRNEEKARLLYDVIDGGDFYRGTAHPDSRSWMNVTFRLPDEELERRLLAEAAAAGLVNLKGHRSVGGLRASLYNAMPRRGVERLAELMRDFAQRAG